MLYQTSVLTIFFSSEIDPMHLVLKSFFIMIIWEILMYLPIDTTSFSETFCNEEHLSIYTSLTLAQHNTKMLDIFDK